MACLVGLESAMKRFFEKGDLWLGALGLAIGFISALVSDYELLTQQRLWSWTAIGVLIGIFIAPAYRWLTSGWRGVRVKSAEVEIPLIGKIEVETTDGHRAVGWSIFVEASTRIATQRLGEQEGLLREALSSLYSLFGFIRGELKKISPSPPPSGERVYTVESYALRMLNDGLRSMLARWHPLLDRWEKAGKAEDEWPLATLCRNDLKVTRMKLFAYTWGLGEMLQVHNLADMLGESPNQSQAEQLRRWTSDDDLAREVAKLKQIPSETEKAVGWHIFVELASRISTQPLADQTGDIREALTSLYKLFDIIREQLKRLPPTTRFIAEAGQHKTVASMALTILNEHLRPFLAKWHPQLSKWERREDKTEAVWADEEECRKELAQMRRAIVSETIELGQLIGVEHLEFPPGG
jgi:hypothetical protein